MGPVYHVFIPDSGGWKWAATFPAPLTRTAARQALAALGANARGKPIRMVRVDGSPQPKPDAPTPE